MRIFLAADSGGSKTVWKLLDESGLTLASVKTEGLGAVKAGILPVFETVQYAKEQLPEAAVPERIFLSLGGPNTEEVENAVRSAWPGVPAVVEREACGKSLLAAAGVLGYQGVVLCGTGSTAVGLVRGELRFCGGWGPVYGDGGSGGGIGAEALKLFLRSLDGLENAGRLAEAFSSLTAGTDLYTFSGRMEIKRRAVEMTRREIASLAPLIWYLALEGDEAAVGLYDRAAKEIAMMANAVTENSCSAKVLLSGGLFTGKSGFIDACKSRFSELSCAEMGYVPTFSPAVSAAMAVLRQAGIEMTEQITKNITEENAK